ncbi:MAG: hypothetical protein QME25_09275 [Bacteroidota bacterium]|nr:hypothetical protein [Bacteroidota bacterium]
MDEIYVEHNVGTPYIKHNYKAILTEMENPTKLQPIRRLKSIDNKCSNVYHKTNSKLKASSSLKIINF